MYNNYNNYYDEFDEYPVALDSFDDTFPIDNQYQEFERRIHHSNYPNINKMSALNLNNIMRQLWEQHVTWTRLTIMSIASNSPDTQLVTARLLRNPTDFEKAFSNFYSQAISRRFSELLREHLVIAADLVVAAKKQDNNAVAIIEKKWYKNADDIAAFLNSINPNWNQNDVKNMLYNHLALTKAEAVAILTNKYAESINLFDQIENQALMMADTFTTGIIKQFPNKFTS